MNDVKPLYKSKTLWTNLFLAVFAMTVPAVEAWMVSNPSMVAMVWSGVNMALRFVTKDKLALY